VFVRFQLKGHFMPVILLCAVKVLDCGVIVASVDPIIRYAKLKFRDIGSSLYRFYGSKHLVNIHAIHNFWFFPLSVWSFLLLLVGYFAEAIKQFGRLQISSHYFVHPYLL